MSVRKVQVVDSAGRPKMVEVDEVRLSAFDHFVRTHLGTMDGSPFGRTRASDATEAQAFLVSQLAYTESEVFEKQYVPMQYQRLVPITFEAGEAAKTIRYEVYDRVGRGKRISTSGDDIPEVDVAYAEKTFDVCYGGIGYSYTQEELRTAAFLRRPLPTSKLAAAIEGYQRHMNEVGLFGESVSSLTGLFNNALIPAGTNPCGKDWDASNITPDEILADFNFGVMTVWKNTAQNTCPTVAVMAEDLFALISTKPRSANSDTTILKYLKENNLAKTERGIDMEIIPGYGLNTAGAGGTRRIMFYDRNKTNLVMHIPLPLRFLAPQMANLRIKTPGEYKYSGVAVRRPLTAYYMDGA